MNIDIIALATKCGFSTVEDRTIYLSKYSKEKLHDCILKLATLLEAEIRKEFDAEIAEFRQVMIAAAEEIHEHWQAHCDDEGCGPSNLMYRLENGIATNYPGYSAGAFQTLTVQNAKLMEALADIANGNVRNITNVDECEHGKYGYESCETCLMEFAEAALTPQPEKEGKE